MYGLTKVKGLSKRGGRRHGLAAVAMAALIFLSALPMPATAQGTSANTYGGLTVVHAGTIGLVPGQTALVAVPNFSLQDGSVKFLKSTINVYDRESKLIYSGESGGLGHELGHIFTLRHGDLSAPGEPVTSRIQVWIEVESSLLYATQQRAENRNADVLPPTYELIDDESGKTVLIGLLLPAILKVRDKNGL